MYSLYKRRSINYAMAISVLFSITGCSSTYTQNKLKEPSAKLVRGKAVTIATPKDGQYSNTVYADSGKMTALATKSAFSRFSNEITISDSCQDLDCLKKTSAQISEYYVIPEILHWEDRNTEWSGKPDKIEVQLSIYEGPTWTELSSTLISGKSKWATFGGDHPQDLLPEPLNAYVESLY